MSVLGSRLPKPIRRRLGGIKRSLLGSNTVGHETRPRLQVRRDFVFRTADRADTVLEIGPAHNAILPKRDGFQTKNVDYIDRDGLVEKYREFKQYSPDDIEDVDYVIPAGASMADVIHDRFDLVLASHVLEHSISLIDFINDCTNLLAPNGVLSLVVPDHRYCFDRFRERSSIGRVIDTSINLPQRPHRRHDDRVLAQCREATRLDVLASGSHGRLPVRARPRRRQGECRACAGRHLHRRPQLGLHAEPPSVDAPGPPCSRSDLRPRGGLPGHDRPRVLPEPHGRRSRAPASPGRRSWCGPMRSRRPWTSRSSSPPRRWRPRADDPVPLAVGAGRMRFVVTLMVRDEVDIIAAFVEHHLAQGADLIIATDNGSVDGTTEVLQRYADLGVLELHHDPVFRKQQGAVVTGMARRAFTEYGADWVINADADEFWVPCDQSLTLRTALEAIPLSLVAFTVPVTNLVGPPAMRGSGIDRLLWRDLRTPEQLQAVGIFAQPTADAVHRGDPDVVVSQGNHFVSLKSTGQPDPAFELEVLHLPWRSWLQYERRVINSGRSYEANPDPASEQEPPWHGRLPAASRRSTAVRVPGPSSAGEGPGRRRCGWCLRLRPLAAGPSARARRPRALCQILSLVAWTLRWMNRSTPPNTNALPTLGGLFVALERERDEARKLADERVARPPRIRDDWLRVTRRTAGAVKRRLRGGRRRR